MAGSVGFVGLGNMGGPMALNLVKAGFELVVHDINSARLEPLVAAGATVETSPEAVAARCHRTICMVETTAQAEAVILGERGITQAAKQGDIVLCMSTIEPLAARRFSEQLAQKGMAMLDAPVSGGTHGAAAGTLSVIVGGPAETFAASEDLFRAMGKNVFHVGDLGHGLAMKLINNMLGRDGDFLRAVAEAVLQILMEADVEGLIGAGRHERSADRLNYRNGYRDRSLDTRLGSLQLRIPKLRQGSYFPPFLEPRKTAEKALVTVIQEAWIGGVSTRRVDELVQAMGLSGISKSQVSKLCKDIDERVNAFLDRPIDGEWPYLWLDATYLKVRDGGRIVSVAAIIAVAVTTEGRREIVGLGLGPSEAEPFWSTFLKGLVKRGLKGVKLVISDAHDGLRHAIIRVLGATWQRCRVHWMRNALAHVAKGQHTMVAAAIRQAFLQPDAEAAQQTWRHVADQLRPRWPKLGTLMDDSEHDVLAYMTFPAQHRTKLHSTNPLERLNKEVKRRADVVGIFPNEASITRLIGAVLLEQNDEWLLQCRYMQIEGMTELTPRQLDVELGKLPPMAA